MNRLFLLVAFLVLGKISYSQYPLTQNLGSDSTIVVSKGALQSRLIPIVVSDTNAANAQRMKSYPGAQLFTTNGNFYYRNSTATKWILVSSGSAGPVNIYNTDGTLTGNRILTGAGNSLYFDGISGLGINTPYDSLLTVDGGIHATGGLRVEKLTTSPGTKALRIDGQGVVSVADTSGGTVTSIATNNGTGITGGTITSTGTLAIDTTIISTRAWRQKGIDSVAALPKVTSVGLTMPIAFNVSGSPVTSAGTLSVTAAGVASQYIRGDGQLATLPTTGGGGSSVSYYLNGSVNQGTFGGNTYYQMNKTPVIGTGTDFTISSNGYIASFITNAGDPDLLNIPAGNWDFEMYFQSSSNSGTPSFYVELYKYNGTTFTLIASSSTNPEFITGGTNVDAYYTPLAVPATTLAITDRLAIRVYVNNSGNTITLHTEDNNLCQVITTFSTGINALNGLTDQVQYFAVGTSGTDFNISSLTDTHTFNLPTASSTNRGALSSADWTTFNSKISPSDTASMLAPYLRKADTTAMLANYVNNVGYGLSKAGQVVSADSSTLANYFLRRKDSMTSTNLLGYVTRTILADTAAAIRSADAGGTVTSVATNNGTGITGGTITTTGTLAIDTLLISTRAWRQKGVDSVAALINSNISGTTNRVSKFTGANTIGNSSIADSSVVGVAMTISSFANVGIGTATPSSRLEVSGNATIKTNFASLTLDNTTSVSPVWMKINNGGGNYLIGAASNVGGSIITSTSPYAFVINAESSRDVVIGTNNLERVRFDSTGKVGIGTTTIDSMLTVAQGAYLQRGVRMSGLPSAPGTRALRIDANGTLSVADTTTGGGGGIGGSGTTNYLPKFTASTTLGDSRLFDNGTITFLGNGDVNASPSTGIFSGTGGTGTNIAGAELRIRGGASTGNAAGGIISFYTSAAGSAGTGVNAGVERMRLTNTGVGIGTTTTDNIAANTGMNLIVQGSTSGANVGWVQAISFDAATSVALYSGQTTSDNPAIVYQKDLRIGNATGTGVGSFAERVRIANGGNVGIGTSTIGSRLQVNGNAAIGYSASTAAPTNGLAVSGNLGVGITAPTEKTEVSGTGDIKLKVSTTSTGSGANASLTLNATTEGQWILQTGNAGAGALRFYDVNAAADRMRIFSNGDVGINTLTAGSKLQVNGNAAIGYSASTAAPTNGLMVAGNVGVNVTPSAWASGFRAIQIGARSAVYNSDINWTGLGNNSFYDGVTYKYITTAPVSTIELGSGVITFGNAPSGTAGTTITGTERMRIDASGNLGLGVVPSAWGSVFRVLQLGNGGSIYNWTGGNLGNVTISSNSYEDASLVSRYINTNGASSYLQNNGEHRWSYAASGTAGNAITYTVGMNLNNSGNLGINTTTIGSRLQVNGNAAIGYSASTAAPTNGLAVAGNVAIGTSTSSIPLTISTSTTQAVNVLTSASITSGFTDIFEILAANQTGGGLSFNIGKARSTKNLGKIAYVHTSNGSNSNRMSWGFFDADNLLNLTAGGTLGVNTTTIGSTLQVNGNAAIGYSASTAAPTNGLVVAGNTSIGKSTNAGNILEVAGASQIRHQYTGAATDLAIGQFNASGDASINNTANGLLQFHTNGIARQIITSGGQITLATGSNVSAIAQTGYSLTGANAQSLIDLAGTWNTTGNPTAIKLNITNTASGASADLMELQVGGVSQFTVTKGGAIQTSAPTGGTANTWKLGTRVASSMAFDATQYLEVEVGGTFYRVALATLAEPEPDPEPLTTPDDRIFREPVRVKAISQSDNQKIKDLEKELAELKEMIKSIKK